MHGHPSAPPASARRQLRGLGLRPRRGLSQSFLEDERTAAAIVRAAELQPGQDDVLEVGPGLGALTRRLVRLARRVVAVELDSNLADWLRSALVDVPNLSVQTADILQVEPARFFDLPFVVVANLPYHITSPALRHLLAAGPPGPARLIVMVQAEVGQRIGAPPGQLSALGVSVQAQARVRVVRHVPSTAFYPRPKVDSVVLRLEPLADAERPVARTDVAEFVRLVQAGFRQPRKTLANSLADGLGIPKAEAQALLERAGLDPSRRPQQLSVADWAALFRTRRAP